MAELLDRYLAHYYVPASPDPARRPSPAALAHVAALDHLLTHAPDVARAIARELSEQRRSLKLIASENYSSLATQLAQANWLTDKYAEGSPGHRFYAGCENVDAIEADAATTARALFGAEHAYVQPHSGADANLVAFVAILGARVEEPRLAELGKRGFDELSTDAWEALRRAFHGQRLLGLDYYAGGHLTHGYRANVSARLFEVHTYGVDRVTGIIDLDALRRQMQKVRPLVLLAGYSAYPRKIDFAVLREMADEVGAVLMVDMAHFAGLVAGKVFTGNFDPVPHAHIVTTTTHKTLRGPRGGLVLCKKELAELVDKGCPKVLGGPLPHVLAAKAVALREAATPQFAAYARAVVDNAGALAEACLREGMPLATGGTDNHLILIDAFRRFGLTGRQAETALRSCGLMLNRNALPFDPKGPWYTSGLRLGTPAVTTRGMGKGEMCRIAAIICSVLTATQPGRADSGAASQVRFDLDARVAAEARHEVAEILASFPLYPEIDAGALDEAIV
jgi:glycine hydroxymethyltransferase